MGQLIKDSNVDSTIIASRNFQEAFKIDQGESTYEILAGWIEVNQQQIDIFAKFCGSAVGYVAMNKLRQEVYSNSKNGKVTNWINRNMYQNSVKTKIRHTAEKEIGTATSVVTEWMVKQSAKGIHDYAAKKTNYKSLEEVYSFLNNYVLTDSNISNNKKARLELAKIRNGLPLLDRDRNKIHETIKEKTVIELEDIPTMSVINNNTRLCETLAYQLFNLYCQKFGDEDGILEEELTKKNFSYTGMDKLLSYYEYLGFTGNYAKEMIRVNANRYDKICRDQAYYLQLGRMMIKEFMFDVPGIDIYSIRERCSYMIQYDPYQLRRKKVQNVCIGTTEVLAGLMVERPDVVLSGGALALSQFQLEDGNVAEIMERELKKNGIGIEAFNLMLTQSKQIQSN